MANGIVEPVPLGFGFEVSGIIRRIGPGNIPNLQVGDRVMAFARVGFATRALIPWQWCSKLPDTLSFQDAATIPAVYATAIYSLSNVGQLEQGQVRRRSCLRMLADLLIEHFDPLCLRWR